MGLDESSPSDFLLFSSMLVALLYLSYSVVFPAYLFSILNVLKGLVLYNQIPHCFFQEMEREISFRTECGLYYSYYKQMLQAPSICEGMFMVL